MIALFGACIFVVVICSFSLLLSFLAFMSRAWRRVSFRRWKEKHAQRQWWEDDIQSLQRWRGRRRVGGL